MSTQLFLVIALAAFSAAQENSKNEGNESTPKKDNNPSLVYLGLPNSEVPQQNEIQSVDVKQFVAGQPYPPELYKLPYLEPQYQVGALPRLQPQIVLYNPGDQGQPILINPGNPPGNFLIPQGLGPNVIFRNNPQNPQGSLFPIAGYPKPAHIPPIEKDAEEIPTNPSKIPPLPSLERPVLKERRKPEKLETFNEPIQPDQNVNIDHGNYPEAGSLQPGERFFILNGDNLFSYPYGGPPPIQQNLLSVRYTNIQPIPQNPPNLSGAINQERSQVLQSEQGTVALNQNPYVDSQQLKPELEQTNTEFQKENQLDNNKVVRVPQQYFGTEFPVNRQRYFLYPQNYAVTQHDIDKSISFNKNIQEIQSAKDEVVRPQVVGQFRFTPNAVPGLFPFKDDPENDAIVVDATYDVPGNSDGRGVILKSEENETSTIKPLEQKESEPSMAQAGPQGTAIAGPGGVAGSAPRGTAIVGKGGLAVSSPQATAVAGTKEEDKRKKPAKKIA